MTISVTNHLNFRGNAREALEFYHSIFGGNIMIFTYEDAHRVEEPFEANQVVWGQVAAENGFRVMAYDVPSKMPWEPGQNAFFVSLRGDSENEIKAFWKKLSVGAHVAEPLAPSSWSPLYGMLKDRFGITWVLDIMAAQG